MLSLFLSNAKLSELMERTGAPGYTPPIGLEGTVMLIGSELISFTSINIGQPALQGVTRGKFKTRPAAHAAGTPVYQVTLSSVHELVLHRLLEPDC